MNPNGQNGLINQTNVILCNTIWKVPNKKNPNQLFVVLCEAIYCAAVTTQLSSLSQVEIL